MVRAMAQAPHGHAHRANGLLQRGHADKQSRHERFVVIRLPHASILTRTARSGPTRWGGAVLCVSGGRPVVDAPVYFAGD